LSLSNFRQTIQIEHRISLAIERNSPEKPFFWRTLKQKKEQRKFSESVCGADFQIPLRTMFAQDSVAFLGIF